MSNQLAFATVTYVLQRQLNRVVGADVPGATATAVRPDGSDGQLPTVGVNLYLFQANPTGEMGNIDLPTRSASRQIIEKPTGVFDLIYLMTFHGSEAKLEPQRVQASVLRYLHAEPCLTKKVIRDQIAAALVADPNHYLKGTNLADQVSTIKITPHKMSLEDLSKVWSVFFQTNYLLTSTYLASYVLLDTEDAGQASLPVRIRGPFALPFSDMTIASVSPDRLPYAPGATVTLFGQGLTGPNKKFTIDGLDAPLQPGATAQQASIGLPAGIRAGIKQVRILDQSPLGASHYGTESNAVVFMLLPAVTAIVYHADPTPKKDHTITVTPALTVGLDQTASLLLNRSTPPAAGEPWSFALSSRPRVAEADPLIFAARDVDSGTYFYRLRIDGVDSALSIDTSNPDPLQQPYDGPTLVIP